MQQQTARPKVAPKCEHAERKGKLEAPRRHKDDCGPPDLINCREWAAHSCFWPTFARTGNGPSARQTGKELANWPTLGDREGLPKVWAKVMRANAYRAADA